MKIYSFYRQGEAFTVPIDQAWSNLPINSSITSKGTLFQKEFAEQANRIDPNDYMFEKITDRILGQMFLVYGKALVARSSD